MLLLNKSLGKPQISGNKKRRTIGQGQESMDRYSGSGDAPTRPVISKIKKMIQVGNLSFRLQ